MGKYSKVIDRLPRMAGEEPSYQEKVNAIRSEIVSEPDFQLHASTLAKRYVDIRLEKNELEEAMYEVNLRLTAVEQLLVDQYEAEGTTSLKLDSGDNVSVQMEPYAQVVDKEAFRLWCLEEGLANLMTIPWASTNSMTKTRLLEGEPEPPGVKAYARSKIVFKRA